MADMVGIVEIAKRLKVNLTTVRRLIARESEGLGLELHRGKGERLLLSRDDADRLVASYEARRGPVTIASQDTAKFDRYGYFYAIQLVPEALPNRVKIGFADNVEQRLNEHRTAAPTVKLLKAWPCKRSWDYAAMDSITRRDCKLVLNEVYEGDVQGFIARGDEFFAVMPDPDAEKACPSTLHSIRRPRKMGPPIQNQNEGITIACRRRLTALARPSLQLSAEPDAWRYADKEISECQRFRCFTA